MIFPRKPEARIPRKVLDYPTGRRSRDAKHFSWWGHPIARLYVIAGQMTLLQNNPDIAAHAQFFGQKEGSISYELVRRMQYEHSELYQTILNTCRDPRYPGNAGVVHKLYERIHKVGVEKQLGQAGNNEHYLRRRNPATEDEVEQARKMLVML